MLELSTLFFIFLIFNLKLNYVNNLIHYYLLQVRASVGLFVRILFSFMRDVRFELVFLFLKLGIFPFHFWYFSLLLKLDWWNIFILIRPNKIIVLRLIFSVYSSLVFMVLLINIFFVIFRALVEKQLKILLGLSSLFNIVWVLRRLRLLYFWFVYFLIYSLNLLLIVVVLFWASKHRFLNIIESNVACLIIFLGLRGFMLLGLPPFLRFFIKIYMLREGIAYGRFFIFLAIRSIIFVYIYLIFFFLSLSGVTSSNSGNLKRGLTGVLLSILTSNLFFSIIFLVLYYLNNIKLKR